MTLRILEAVDRARDDEVCAWHGCTSRAFIWHSNGAGEYVPVCREHDEEGKRRRGFGAALKPCGVLNLPAWASVAKNL